MTVQPQSPRGSSFRRTAVALASSGVVLGASALAATPAVAATDADCGPSNTFSSASLPDPTTAIQTLLDEENVAVVCISGSITLTDRLVVIADTEFHGLGSGAGLVGTGSTHVIFVAEPNEWISIENLHISNGGGAWGGAVQAYWIEVRNSTFEDNVASPGTDGGAIFAMEEAIIESSVFVGNSANSGGAIAASVPVGGLVSITSSVFRDNHAIAGDGGAFYATDIGTVTSSTFDGNTAAGYGAGGYILGVATVTNSTYVDNAATAGSALHVTTGSVTQSTFLDNTTSAFSSAGAATLTGSIFASSTASTAQLSAGSVGPITDGGGNVFTSDAEPNLESPTASTLFSQTSAAIFETGVLADNGGPTPTLALAPDGPAIDAVPAGSLATDQRGETRGALGDAGAFEYIPPPPPAVEPAAPTLPPTGADTAPLLAAGAALLALGAAARAVGRRQRRA